MDLLYSFLGKEVIIAFRFEGNRVIAGGTFDIYGSKPSVVIGVGNMRIVTDGDMEVTIEETEDGRIAHIGYNITLEEIV